MNKKFADFVISNIKKKQVLSERDERICRYTLEGLFSFFTKIIVIIVISIFLGTIFETLLLFLLYGFLRSVGFGIHASKDIYCWISSIIIYVITPFAVKFLVIPTETYYICFIIFSILLVIYSPADTPKRPLIRSEKRARNKMLVSFILLIFVLLTILLDSILLENAILISMTLQMVCVIPLTYKIFNTRYNNYLYYKPTMV